MFLLVAGVGIGLIRWEFGNHIAREQKIELERVGALEAAVVTALKMLAAAGGAPCSSEFLEEMRTVAFLPDGLNEFMFSPGESVHCSADGKRYDPPIQLGRPDIPSTDSNHLSWRIRRDLGIVRHPGATGAIAQLGDFAVAIPEKAAAANSSTWLQHEVVARSGDGTTVPLNSDRSRLASADSGAFGVLRCTSCLKDSVFCVTSHADLAAGAGERPQLIALGLLTAALVSWLLANSTLSWIAKHWSFEERFRRGMNAKSVVLAYQPIVDAKTEKLVAVEVLARWRDYDGRILPPSLFLPLVIKNGVTRAFTQIVIDRAYEELNSLQTYPSRLGVNFNIFASDFESSLVLHWLRKFRSDGSFWPGVELVEEQDIDMVKAQQTIEALSDAGVPTFIDDFGTGYSNIERIARLPVKGVKLDKSFAMSPPDSVMGRMLMQIIEMIKTSGRFIVVEGVETRAQLDLLQSTGSVDLVQGYVISKPVRIETLRSFLALYPDRTAPHQAGATPRYPAQSGAAGAFSLVQWPMWTTMK